MERDLVRESGAAFRAYAEVQSGPLHGVGVVKAAVSAVKTAFGTLQAFGRLRRWRPDVVLMTGGYSNLPVALAAAALRIPALMYLPDIEPGLAIKLLRPFVQRVGVTADESRAFFRSGQAVVTGYPLRKAVLAAKRADGIAHFKLKRDQQTLLVFGGSRGARSINNAVLDILPDLLTDGWQIIHVTGTLDAEAVGAKLAALGSPADYRAYAYLHDDMGLALAAADVALCRSGASTLGELPYFGLPAILVPYPYAWRYQKVNAEHLASRGAAILMRDEDMARDLLPTLRRLHGDPAALAALSAGARALAGQADGAANLARELMTLAGQKT